MNLQVDVERVLLAHKAVRAELLAERSPDGHWAGQLASSPPATAAAISALVVAHQRDTGTTLRENLAGDGQVLEQIVQSDLSELLLESVQWLARHQNPDGGWGDCDTGHSNLAATVLVQSAFRLTGVPAKYADLIARADQYIASQGGPGTLRRSQADNKALTAAVLANAALAGIASWRQVPTLPFELLRLPKRWQSYIQLPYPKHASPLMLAVGLAKSHHDPPRNPLTRILRRSVKTRSLEWLARLQAADDSFLGSTLVTAFVVMSVASIGDQQHPIVQRGVEYLLATVRGDSSWPIKTGIATRNTTLALNSLSESPALSYSATQAAYRRLRSTMSSISQEAAWQETAATDETAAEGGADNGDMNLLAHASEQPTDGDEPFSESCLNWLLGCQRRQPNLVTEVPPGGWGWSDQPGALPNASDTADALVALAHWRRRDHGPERERVDEAARRGIAWLLDLQHDDGGWPTFYRDESTFRVEVSAPDVTAYVLRALAAWRELAPVRDERSFAERIATAIDRGWPYLKAQQRDDGRFVPFWFGNEHHPEQYNPVYGTAQVLFTCHALGRLQTTLAHGAAQWLASAQHAGGGWGPPRLPVHYSAVEKNDGFRARRTNEAMAKLCSVEETALAVSALLPLVSEDATFARAVSNGLTWLAAAVEQDAHRRPAVIGFYPSHLWYHERLYPLVFAAGALSQAVRQLALEPRIAAPVG